MKGLHVEVQLLAGLFLVMVGLLVVAGMFSLLPQVTDKLLEWGGLILGALLLAVKGRNDKTE